ncbi:unnamed protein product, partial [Didymodactylos carnosus]
MNRRLLIIFISLLSLSVVVICGDNQPHASGKSEKQKKSPASHGQDHYDKERRQGDHSAQSHSNKDEDHKKVNNRKSDSTSSEEQGKYPVRHGQADYDKKRNQGDHSARSHSNKDAAYKQGKGRKSGSRSSEKQGKYPVRHGQADYDKKRNQGKHSARSYSNKDGAYKQGKGRKSGSRSSEEQRKYPARHDQAHYDKERDQREHSAQARLKADEEQKKVNGQEIYSKLEKKQRKKLNDGQVHTHYAGDHEPNKPGFNDNINNIDRLYKDASKVAPDQKSSDFENDIKLAKKAELVDLNSKRVKNDSLTEDSRVKKVLDPINKTDTNVLAQLGIAKLIQPNNNGDHNQQPNGTHPEANYLQSQVANINKAIVDNDNVDSTGYLRFADADQDKQKNVDSVVKQTGENKLIKLKRMEYICHMKNVTYNLEWSKKNGTFFLRFESDIRDMLSSSLSVDAKNPLYALNLKEIRKEENDVKVIV